MHSLKRSTILLIVVMGLLTPSVALGQESVPVVGAPLSDQVDSDESVTIRTAFKELAGMTDEQLDQIGDAQLLELETRALKSDSYNEEVMEIFYELVVANPDLFTEYQQGITHAAIIDQVVAHQADYLGNIQQLTMVQLFELKRQTMNDTDASQLIALARESYPDVFSEPIQTTIIEPSENILPYNREESRSGLLGLKQALLDQTPMSRQQLDALPKERLEAEVEDAYVAGLGHDYLMTLYQSLIKDYPEIFEQVTRHQEQDQKKDHSTNDQLDRKSLQASSSHVAESGSVEMDKLTASNLVEEKNQLKEEKESTTMENMVHTLLPATGESNNLILMGLAALLIIGGIYLVYRSRK
ncbi:LPXTG cell wall anchor domain-containing protein [Hutsoniella sourekii]